MTMSEKDFEIVCSAIDAEKQFLNEVSQSIWKNPELNYQEVHAHDVLTEALSRCGFAVEKQYVMPTAFKAEHSSISGGGPTVCILLEYDALPEMGHACGHNLIAEAGLAASMAIRAAMLRDPHIEGKLLVLGSPAEEGGGGKIRLLQAGALRGVDAAFMVHPTKYPAVCPKLACASFYKVDFIGREAHAAGFPWEGINALDAAVACYQNFALLRQQIRPMEKINVVIIKGGAAANIIPALCSMDIILRSRTRADMKVLQRRVEACIDAAASATGCEAQTRHDDANTYEDLLTNRVLADLFRACATRLGVDFTPNTREGFASTDMGNVSYVVPSIQPCYAIETVGANHTVDFAEAAGSEKAQVPTLNISKAMAMTALAVMRCPETRREAKQQFEDDLAEEAKLK